MKKALLAPGAALALIVPLTAAVTTAPAAHGGGITYISFEDMPGGCYLQNVKPLRNRYAAAKFRGPGPKTGGAVLGCTGGARTGTHFLQFHDELATATGQPARGPEQIRFPDRQKRVTVWLSQAADPDTATFRMVGRRGGTVIRTATTTTETSDWVRLTVRNRKGFDSVTVSAPTEPDGAWKLDDLTTKG